MGISDWRCKHCGWTLYRLALLAMAEDLGARTSPDANTCPHSPDGEHDFSDPSDLITAAKTEEK